MKDRKNPFVGPRSLKWGEALFGRERESEALFHLLVAERIVLLYSPSGAGKTSLIQAGLIPKLEREGFWVLTGHECVRVSTSPGQELAERVNRYVHSTLLSLDESLGGGKGSLQTSLAEQDIAHYLADKLRQSENQKTPILIIDQFEEILTKDPTDLAAKREFFRQVGKALENKGLWALFAMREEYRSALDQFRNSIPTRFQNTFRLDLLDDARALKAFRKPIESVGVAFEEELAKKVIDDLRKVNVEGITGTPEVQVGPYVEPMLLQVMGERLWDGLPERAGEITTDDIKGFGSVDRALGDYYGERVLEVAQTTDVSERHIREWCERSLITEQGFRGQVQRGRDESLGLVNQAVEALENAHLVRAEKRRGNTWYELAHDRLIAPIRENNQKWREDHLSHFQRQAAVWDKERSDRAVPTGRALVEALKWANDPTTKLTRGEQEFLEVCKKARDRERLVKVNRGLRAAILLGISVVTYIAYHTIWLEARPWGTLRNLATNVSTSINGAVASAGRSTKEFQHALNFPTRVVSRIHLFLTKDLTAFDMRSLNGTTVNARFLLYGEPQHVEDGDVFVLAGIGPLRFSTIVYSPLQFWTPQPTTLDPPKGWGLLLDGKTKTVLELTKLEHFVAVNQEDRLQLIDGPDAAFLVIQKFGKGFNIQPIHDGADVWATMKMGDYTFPTCKLPYGRQLNYLSPTVMEPRYDEMGNPVRELTVTLEGFPCGFLRKRDDIRDVQKKEFSLSEVTYSIGDVAFQIVPVVTPEDMSVY